MTDDERSKARTIRQTNFEKNLTDDERSEAKRKEKIKMKKTNKKNKMKTIKIITIILAIILISIISFFGIYTQNKNKVSNSVKDYQYAMDINGARTIKLKVNTDTKSNKR